MTEVFVQSHSGGTLDTHLQNVSKILQVWEATEAVISAGRYHSIYGTASFKSNYDTKRADIKAIIGIEAEKLVYDYCTLDREKFIRSLAEQLAETTFKMSDLPLAYLLLADVLEQISRWSDVDEFERYLRRPHFTPGGRAIIFAYIIKYSKNGNLVAKWLMKNLHTI